MSALRAMLLACLIGLAYYGTQALLLQWLFGRLPHPLGWLAQWPDPLQAVLLWNLLEHLLALLLPAAMAGVLLARLPRPWEAGGTALVAGLTLFVLQWRAAPASPFPLWYPVAQAMLLTGALLAALAWQARRRHA